MNSLINAIEWFQTFSERASEALPTFSFDGMFDKLQSIHFWINLSINISLILTVYFALKYFYMDYKRRELMRELQGTKKKVVKDRDNPLLSVKLIKKLYDTLTHTLGQKGKLEKRDKLFNAFLIGILVVSIALMFVKQYLIALIAPFFLLKYLVGVLESMEVTDLEYMHLQLPKGIDSLLKAASRYGDLRNIFLEASRGLPYPIREEFEVMARRMNSREAEEVLLEMKNKYDDIWINSFVFILVSMLDDAERDLALDNLRNLRDMLNNENNLKAESVTSKKLSVNTNYALAGIAAVLGLGTVIFFQFARDFFFSTPLGIAAFVGGYALVLATIKINIRLSSTKDE